MNPKVEQFRLHADYICLDQLLKVLAWASSGGEAHCMVEQGVVTVDGRAEQRKRAKIRAGQTVALADGRCVILISAAD